MVENILDIRDDVTRLASLIDRAMVIHEDVSREYILPIYKEDLEQNIRGVLLRATANSYTAKIKTEIIYDILEEAWTLAHSIEKATNWKDKPEASSNTPNTPTADDATQEQPNATEEQPQK